MNVETASTIGHFVTMKMKFLIPIMFLTLGACAQVQLGNSPPVDLAPGEGVIRPKPRPASFAPPPPENATTVEDFDTTTVAERDAASNTNESEGSEVALGLTIATLGSPAKPGFWLETPLVDGPRKGRVVASANGESVLVDLVPIDGPEGAGSHISLAALRLLGVSLTGLHELQIFGL